MKPLIRLLATTSLALAAPAVQAAMPACPPPEGPPVPAAPALSEGIAAPEARALFEIGLDAYLAGEAGAALRAFRAARLADPGCALCHWGEALALGPRAGAEMPQANVRPAWEAIVRAQSLAGGAAELERELIEATRHRYGVSPTVTRAQLDHAWATAIGRLAERAPGSEAIRLLLEEAEAIVEGSAEARIARAARG